MLQGVAATRVCCRVLQPCGVETAFHKVYTQMDKRKLTHARTHTCTTHARHTHMHSETDTHICTAGAYRKCGDICMVLQCVAVCCSVLQCVAMCCSVLHLYGVAACCSVLQYVAVCCGVLQCVAVCCTCGISRMWRASVWRSSVLPCVAVRCSVLWCVAVCCIVQTGLQTKGVLQMKETPLKNPNGVTTSGSRRWHLQIWW